jgi:hypothetical protein
MIWEFDMNIHAQEIQNRFGKTMLENMQKQLPKGFHIVATDDSTVVVGNKYKNIVFSRKTCKIVSEFVFEGNLKINRKGVL